MFVEFVLLRSDGISLLARAPHSALAAWFGRPTGSPLSKRTWDSTLWMLLFSFALWKRNGVRQAGGAWQLAIRHRAGALQHQPVSPVSRLEAQRHDSKKGYRPRGPNLGG